MNKQLCKFQAEVRDSEWDLHNLLGRSVLNGSVVCGTVDAVVCVQVFVAGNLEEGGASLAVKE